MNRLRLVRGLRTQAEAARRMGVTPPDVSRYENGRSNPTPEQMRNLCQFYGVTVDKLMDRNDWDYSKKCPISHRDRRRSGKGTGTAKFTVRLSERLASVIQAQCKQCGYTQAQYMVTATVLIEGRLKDAGKMRDIPTLVSISDRPTTLSGGGSVHSG